MFNEYNEKSSDIPDVQSFRGFDIQIKPRPPAGSKPCCKIYWQHFRGRCNYRVNECYEGNARIVVNCQYRSIMMIC